MFKLDLTNNLTTWALNYNLKTNEVVLHRAQPLTSHAIALKDLSTFPLMRSICAVLSAAIKPLPAADVKYFKSD